MRAPASSKSSALSVFGFAFLTTLILRLAVVQNDLWLDEVWSVQLASHIESPADIVSQVHHDNNHYLNTFWLWVCGPEAGTLLQRGLSLVTGCLSVLLIGILVRPAGLRAAGLAMLIASYSALLVQYSTEARGYAPALFCALAAHWFLRRFLREECQWSAVAFSTLCLLGTLSHLSFLQYYFAAVFWSVAVISGRHKRLTTVVRELLKLHVIAVAGIGALYLLDVRHLAFGGGPRLQAMSVMQNAVSVFAGGPLDHPFRVVVCVLVVVGIVMGLRRLAMSASDEWKFFACLFLLFPLLRVVIFPAAMMFERYFMIPLGFAAIPLGLAGAHLRDAGRMPRWAVAVATGCFIVGSLQHLWTLQELGRGAYEPTMKMIADQSPDGIRISSDHPFRNRLLIEHYAARHLAGRPLEYVELDDWRQPPEWMICHHLPRDTDPPVNYFTESGQPRQTISVSGVDYQLAQHTRTGELSGCEWLCYRRSN